MELDACLVESANLEGRPDVSPGANACGSREQPFSAGDSLLERERMLLAREADLLARRCAAARELRRSRRESSTTAIKLASIESLISDLTQAVLHAGCGHLESIPDAHSIEVNHDIEDELLAKIQEMQSKIDGLRSQNDQLANELAQSSVRRSINKSSDANATMSWEQRKALIFAQDVEDSAAADTSSHDRSELREAIERLRSDVQSRDAELAQLRELLEQQPTQCDDGMAIGAAAIANLLDSDELIREERQRLQTLQTEWESKFCQMEIAASIERANLARERQQLERQNVELEEQLAHLKRELRQEEITGPNQPRRWFAKLGLGD